MGGKAILSLSIFLISLAAMAEREVSYPRRFDYSAEEINTVCERYLKAMENDISNIEALPLNARKTPFRHTFLAFEEALTQLNAGLGPVLLLKNVSTIETVRDAAAVCEEKYSNFLTKIYTRSALYLVLAESSRSGEPLDAQDRQLVEKTLIEFKYGGAALGAADKQKFVQIQERINELSRNFEKNSKKDNEAYVLVDREKLAGLDAELIASLVEERPGVVRVPVRRAFAYPVMEAVHDESVRKLVTEAHLRIGGQANVDILEEILKLRQEAAELLGYHSHAELVAEPLMAQNPQRIQDFLIELHRGLTPKRQADLKEMQTLKRKDNEGRSVQIHYWDWLYYSDKIKRHKYAINADGVKEYFPVDKVMSGIFQLFEKVFGIQLKEVHDAVAWHPDVKLYKIIKGDETMALVYTDLYPREGKYGHYCAQDIYTGHRTSDGKYRAPVSAILGNFLPGTNGRPALLTHDDVVTLLHEFGHILHMSFTTARYAKVSGTSVKRDFVEVPSQLFELWAWASESLALLSSHYQRGVPLPPETVTRMIEARNVLSGVDTGRQIALALSDLRFHSEPMTGRTVKVMRTMMERHMGIPLPESSLFPANFGHMLNGYDGRYGGYTWALAYAVDARSRFEQEGVLSRATGDDCAVILAAGGTVEPDKLIEDFLKRPYNAAAFLRSLGA